MGCARLLTAPTFLYTHYYRFRGIRAALHGYGTAAATAIYPVLYTEVHAGFFFRVSVIHQTLTWTAGSVTCVRDHSDARVCVCVYTRGLGTPTMSQDNICYSETFSPFVLVLCDGVRPSDL